MKNLVIITLLVLIFVTSNFAQTTSKNIPNKKEKIDQKFDRISGRTTITYAFGIEGYPPVTDGIALSLTGSFIGRKTTDITNLAAMGFIISYTEKKYSSSSQLVLIADSEIFRINNESYNYENGNSEFTESLIYILKADKLKKIVNCKVLELQLGDVRYTFTEAQLQAVRDFYALLVP